MPTEECVPVCQCKCWGAHVLVSVEQLYVCDLDVSLWPDSSMAAQPHTCAAGVCAVIPMFKKLCSSAWCMLWELSVLSACVSVGICACTSVYNDDVSVNSYTYRHICLHGFQCTFLCVSVCMYV